MKIEKVKNLKPLDRCLYFITEREAIRLKKESGVKPPWSDDSIISTYRFCNVNRENDKVTRWITANWREPYKFHSNIWFALIVARLLNNPDTLQKLGYVSTWKPDKFLKVLNNLKDSGQTVFNGAYIVSTNGVKQSKLEYLAERVLTPIWNDRELLTLKSTLLADYHKKLMQYDGLGSFIAAQVIADLKYIHPLDKSKDWWTFAASGPGSRRGLNRLLERPVDASWKESEWHSELLKVKAKLDPALKAYNISLHAQDLQNCCCEFDKYERTLHDEGRPKQIYKPKG